MSTGEVDRPTYAKFLVGLYYVYSRMEELLDQQKEHQFVAPIHFPNGMCTINTFNNLNIPSSNFLERIQIFINSISKLSCYSKAL